MNKAQLLQGIIDALREELARIDAATRMANEEVVPDSELSESQREPRAVENAYFVDSQQKHAREIKDAILTYETLTLRNFAPTEPVATTAVVELELA